MDVAHRPRGRWADLSETEDEELGVEQGVALTLDDNSYQHPPPAEGLVDLIAGSAKLGNAPSNFSFLFAKGMPSTPSTEAAQGTEVAPSEDALSDVATSENVSTSTAPVPQAALPIVTENPPSPSKSRARKRQPTHRQDDPSAKVSRSREPERKAAPESNGWDRQRTESGESWGRQRTASSQGQIPEASEEEWQHRIDGRKKAVAQGKDTDEYRWFASNARCGAGDAGELSGRAAPSTPDPTDRAISKRRFKEDLLQWRWDVKRAYLQGLERQAAMEAQTPRGISKADYEERLNAVLHRHEESTPAIRAQGE